MGRRAVVALWFLGFPVACGGRVLEDSTPDNGSTVDAATTTKQATTPSSGSSSDQLGGTVALPDCVLGVLQSKLAIGDTCPYVYSGRCYTTKVKACACACPQKTGTTCSSGFPEFDGTTLVTCR